MKLGDIKKKHGEKLSGKLFSTSGHAPFKKAMTRYYKARPSKKAFKKYYKIKKIRHII